MKNRKILIPNKWLLFTAHPVPSKSLPIPIRQLHGDIAIGPFFAIDIEFGITIAREFGGKGYRTAMGGAGHDPALV